MNSPFRRPGLVVALVTGLIALTAFLSPAPSLLVHAERQVAPSEQAAEDALASASLHNPTFDNHKWYEFNVRYEHSYPTGAWLPDDDTPGGPQDWRLWYLAGKDIVQTGAEETLAQSVEAVWMRTYGSGVLLGGLYQVIYNTTPCLTYEFEMYGQSRPAGGDNLYALQVGIDRAGWHPDTANDPAVHSSFPSSTVWGTSYKYEFSYGLLSVTAEAWADEITVYTYADATGGTSHAVLWDTGSLEDATPAMIHDPDDLPSPSGIGITGVVTTSTTAQIEWTTTNEALGQVYYRLIPSGGTPPTYPNKIYLPLVSCGGCSAWQATALNKTPTTSHAADLTGLQPDSEYEYIVVSRGLSGGQCETWVSETKSFTTAP